MSEYRRFVAYIYEYRDGRKAENTGHIRVDARDGVCRMRIQLQMEKAAKSYARLYAFIRKKGKLPCISLGECASPNGACRLTVTTPEERFAGSDWKFQDICGIYIRTEQGREYISVWDDEEVSTQDFVTVWEMDDAPSDEASDNLTMAQTAPQTMTQTAPQTMTQTAPQTMAQTTPQEAPALAERWEQFCRHYPGIEPFADGEITDCVQISPKDISFLGCGEWRFGNNLFLRQAHARYGHLLLGRHENGKFVLGVPGTRCGRQDEHLARMFGFPEFKEMASPVLPAGESVKEEKLQAAEHVTEEPSLAAADGAEQSGYWYHFLE